MSPKLRRILTGFVVTIMAVWFFGGLLLFPDAPVAPCDPKIDYLYSNHPHGYCGKQGQSRTALDFYRFTLWQDILFCVWPLGMATAYLLTRGLPKP